MKKLFQRSGKSGASGKVDSFLERDTYWDEQEYDWDSAEEEIEAAEADPEEAELLEEDADDGYESIEEEEEALTEAVFQEADGADREAGPNGNRTEADVELDMDLDSYPFGEAWEENEEPGAGFLEAGSIADNAAMFSGEDGMSEDTEEYLNPADDTADEEAEDTEDYLNPADYAEDGEGYLNPADYYEMEGTEHPEDDLGKAIDQAVGYQGMDADDRWMESRDRDASELYDYESGNLGEENEGDAYPGYDAEAVDTYSDEAFYEAEEEEPEEEDDFWEESAVQPAGAYRRQGREAAARPVKPAANRKRAVPNRGQEPGLFSKIGGAIRSMDLMDRVMVVSGVAVLVLAIVTGSVFIHINTKNKQVAGFADVGKQLEGIGMIGESGLMAVASVQLAKLGAATPEPEEDPSHGYDETGYERDVSVEPNFTSIQKDLKIKFINKKSDKLVANVPFAVTVKDPDGKEQIWSDDDMDGIIHKKDIKPGTYLVAMEPLTDEKYAGYTLFTEEQSVEVKKEIAYEKVNVANEVKKESEVNAAQEDTRKNETVVESTLKDTVAWVESKVISATYNEVAKSTIPDPVTLAVVQRALFLSSQEGTGADESAGIMPMTESDGVESSAEESSAVSEEPTEPVTPPETPENPSTPEPTATPTPAPTPTPEPTPTPTTEPTEEPTQTPPPATATPTVPPTETPATATPTAPATETPATPTPTAPATQTPATPTPGATLAKGTVTVTPALLNAFPGTSLVAKATAAGFTSGQKIGYTIVSSNNAVATASVDANGNINISAVADGTAVLTVTANYENGGTETQATASINISVQSSNTLTLDKNILTVYAEVPTVINAKFSNETAPVPVLTAESSDTRIASVTVDKTAVTVTGVGEGTAIITVKCKSGNQELSATCSVTVRKHPREDNVTPLKDATGQQLYVMSGNDYREATRADYYSADKFFIKGEAKYSGWQTLDGKVYYFKADGSKVTGEQVIQGAKYNFASDGSLVTGGNGTMGIDVSKWNGSIDWNAVKNSGVSYVIIRCGYRGSAKGQLIEDPKFETNIKGATAVGLKVGVYFFSQAVDEMEAVEEASMVLGQIKNYKISYPVFLDVEASGGRADNIDKATRTAVCKAFCQTIQNGGYTAGVYANKNWLENKIDAGSLSAYKIWLAQYAAQPTYKGRYDLWQYRSTGSVSGISGNVDFNISYLGY